MPACASCHGENGEGNRLLNAPSLQRLEGWYFLEQMRKFRSGERGYHPQDIGGQAMAAASQGDLGSKFAQCGRLFVLMRLALRKNYRIGTAWLRTNRSNHFNSHDLPVWHVSASGVPTSSHSP